MVQRIWSLQEANESLATVDAMLRSAQTDVATMKEARAALTQLQQERGDAIVMHDHADHQQYQALMASFHEARQSLGGTLREFHEMGVEVKDVELGLIDYRADLGGRPVYLCWVQGEEDVGHWHSLEGGFAARRPIPDLDALGT